MVRRQLWPWSRFIGASVRQLYDILSPVTSEFMLLVGACNHVEVRIETLTGES